MQGEPRDRSRPRVRIRDLVQRDLAAVHTINEEAVPAMNSLALERLAWFAREAVYFRVAEADSQIAGFLICLAPEAPYDSPNFGWLRDRFTDFLYIDRVAVSSRFHRRGIASALYLDAAATEGRHCRLLAAEVNLRPANPESLRFHQHFGFKPVGSQDHGYVEVQYMVCPLPLEPARL